MKNPPKIFSVNWFRKDENGRFLWPGFGENIRVLKWIIDRIKNRAEGKDTPIGIVPRPEDIDTSGLDISKKALEKLLSVDIKEWKNEIQDIKKFLDTFGSKIPQDILEEYQKLYNQVV
jgi:phosphoenolpyruvate carboxykinase (GTP)